MKRLFLLCCLLTAAITGFSQHPQRMLSDITACSDMACIEEVRKKYKAFKTFEPLRTELDKNVYEYMLDIGYTHGQQKKGFDTIFRISLLVDKDQLLYAQVEQLTPGYQLEATYVFKNKVAEIENYLQGYNQQQKSTLSYKALISRLTNRNPTLFRLK